MPSDDFDLDNDVYNNDFDHILLKNDKVFRSFLLACSYISSDCGLCDDQIDNFDNGYSEPDVYSNYYNDCNEHYIFENVYLVASFLYCLVSNLLLEVVHKILLS